MKRLIALLPVLALTACVYVQDSHVRNHGTEVSKQEVSLVEPGKTDKAWILLHLGTPDQIHADKDGMEVYEYVSERTERSERKFILLFSVESDKVISRKVTRVVLRNGIVESINTVDA
jgi:outer membrane protein assembly factor BamE (lipoprotein component of BamABCDE complex)